MFFGKKYLELVLDDFLHSITPIRNATPVFLENYLVIVDDFFAGTRRVEEPASFNSFKKIFWPKLQLIEYLYLYNPN